MYIQDPDGHVLRFGTDPDEKAHLLINRRKYQLTNNSRLQA